MKKHKSTPTKSAQTLLSRRQMLALMGGTGGALFASLTIGQFGGSIVSAQQFDNEYSHGNDTDPDYNVVFPSALVNSMVIRMSPENWQLVQDDLTNLLGGFGISQGNGPGGGGGQGGQPPAGGGQGGQPPAGGGQGGQPPAGGGQGGQPPAGGGQGGQPPAGGGQGGQPPAGGGNLSFTDSDPIWVPVTVEFGDEVWEHVGFRYKGNSTLNGAWGSGSLKMGFKLNFDKFEDDYPEIDNQRFFGFDELSFSSNYRDASYLREKVAADIFRNAGIPSAQSAFYAISIDYGDGVVNYVGLYTALEEIDDTVLDTQFSDNDGNLYKPEGTGATFMAGTFDEASFEKKTNEDEADFSDILALFDALHSDTRTSDPEQWRNNLESVLNVGGFLQWLAVNTVIQNWDTYGAMAHNYYLYNNPTTGLLTWIPWDNNEALSEGGRNNTGSLDLTNTGADWPLISFLINDPVYHAFYVSAVEETINTVFEPTQMTTTYQTLHTLIAPYVTGEAMGTPDMAFVSTQTFENALSELINHVNQRYQLAQTYVNTQ